MPTQKKTRATTTAKRSSEAKASTGTRRRARRPTPDPARIAERAYFIGLAGGSDPVANWLQAEQELAVAA